MVVLIKSLFKVEFTLFCIVNISFLQKASRWNIGHMSWAHTCLTSQTLNFDISIINREHIQGFQILFPSIDNTVSGLGLQKQCSPFYLANFQMLWNYL